MPMALETGDLTGRPYIFYKDDVCRGQPVADPQLAIALTAQARHALIKRGLPRLNHGIQRRLHFVALDFAEHD